MVEKVRTWESGGKVFVTLDRPQWNRTPIFSGDSYTEAECKLNEWLNPVEDTQGEGGQT